jgi:flotillin
MARTMPPMMQVTKEIGGVELPESLIKFIDAMDGKSAPTARNGDGVPVGS